MDLFNIKYFNNKLIFLSLYNEQFGIGHIKRTLTINQKVSKKNIHLITIGDKFRTSDFLSNNNVKINNLNKIIDIILNFKITNETFLVLDISNCNFYKEVKNSQIIFILNI